MSSVVRVGWKSVKTWVVWTEAGLVRCVWGVMLRNAAIVFVCVLANGVAYLAYRNGAVANASTSADVQLPALPPTEEVPVAPAPAPPTPAPPVTVPAVAPTPEPVAAPAPKSQPVHRAAKRPAAPAPPKVDSQSSKDDSLLKMEANPYKRGE